MSPIIATQQRFRELGRIRMGMKGPRGAPKKLETWRLTSASRELLEGAAAIYGGTVEEWPDAPGRGEQFQLITDTDLLDVVFPPGQTLTQWMELWSGGGCQKRCDGVRQVLRDVACSCPSEISERMELAAKGEACKPATRLNVILPKIPDIGVWRLESHGYYAASELSGTAQMMELATRRGQLIPARLRLDKRMVKRPGQPTNQFTVPVIEISQTLGDVMQALGMVDEQGQIRLNAPIERKSLPETAAAPEDRPFALEQGPVETASLPGDPPPLPEDKSSQQRIYELVERFGEKAVVAVADSQNARTITASPQLHGAPSWVIDNIADALAGNGAPRAPEHPCPHCGSECKQWLPDQPQKPSWRCTNPECTGGPDDKPWTSFHNDPWKPGGEIEQMRSEAGVGDSAVTGSAASHDSEPVRQVEGDSAKASPSTAASSTDPWDTVRAWAKENYVPEPQVYMIGKDVALEMNEREDGRRFTKTDLYKLGAHVAEATLGALQDWKREAEAKAATQEGMKV